MSEIEVSDEDLVKQARAAFEAGADDAFRAATAELFARYQRTIAGLVTRRLSQRRALNLLPDVVQDVYREILTQLRAPRLKPAMRVMFKLTVNTTCRDMVEIALRHEGYGVESRHSTRRVAQRPDVVPHGQRVSYDQPLDAESEDGATLADVIADSTATLPDVVALRRLERLELMRTLSLEQRLMVVVYSDMQEYQLKAEAIAAKRGLSVSEVRSLYTEACRILARRKELGDE